MLPFYLLPQTSQQSFGLDSSQVFEKTILLFYILISTADMCCYQQISKQCQLETSHVVALLYTLETLLLFQIFYS